jgi:hypothetical protein
VPNVIVFFPNPKTWKKGGIVNKPPFINQKINQPFVGCKENGHLSTNG